MDENFWETLLLNIESQRVIPIVGPELLTVQHKGVEKSLQRYVAEVVALERGINSADLNESAPLNDLVWRCVEEKKIAREVIYKRIKDLTTDAKLAIPESLLTLARIRHFKLFVTTTFDSHLERAINQVRAPHQAKVLTYTPKGSTDLPEAPLGPNETIIYHLLGRASIFPDDYVITEEDMLEFVYSLQDRKYRPVLLFDALRANNLLIIGSTFSDWLARFFIRGAKGERLSQHRERMFLADRLAGTEPNLVVFLERYTNNTSKIFDKGANEFVSELWQRYSEVHAHDEPVAAIAAEDRDKRPGTEPSIFLSYASEDLKQAQAIRDELANLGWSVWFDKIELGLGDNWDLKIGKSIKSCDLFLPIVSANTEDRPKGYFRKEWNEAAEVSKTVDESLPFLLPILIDTQLEADDALVPDRFRKVQWQRLPAGEINEKFRAKMQQLLRDTHKRRRGR